MKGIRPPIDGKRINDRTTPLGFPMGNVIFSGRSGGSTIVGIVLDRPEPDERIIDVPRIDPEITNSFAGGQATGRMSPGNLDLCAS
jgi:hypothetical protein